MGATISVLWCRTLLREAGRFRVAGVSRVFSDRTNADMVEDLKAKIFATAQFAAIAERAATFDSSHPLHVRSVSGSLMAFLASHLFEQRATPVVLVVPEKDRAEQLRDDCAVLLGEGAVYLLVHGSQHEGVLLDMTAPIAQVETLKALSRNERVVVVASAEGLAQPLPPPARVSNRSLLIEAGKDVPFEELLGRLASLGFERKDFVESYGDFAVRGGILDVYPYVGENPVRFEFWGDTVESIREFDPLSQRSIRSLASATLVARLALPGESLPASLFDYLAPDAVLILDEPLLLHREVEELLTEGITGCFEWPTLERFAAHFPRIIHSSLEPAAGAIDFHASAQPAAGGKIRHVVEQFRTLHEKGIKVVLTCDSKEEEERIRELIDDELIRQATVQQQGEAPSPLATVEFTTSSLAFHSGFIYPAAGLALFTEHEIFGRLKRRSLAKRRAFRGISQKELTQLRRGDYVVHQDYGIGRFGGLKKIAVRGVEQEVMKLVYEEDDVVYVNVSAIGRVQKYSSREGHVPKLSRLGSPQWDRLKERARRNIKDIARDLITLYARRKLEPGFAFAADTPWQKEMEASFMFEDTPDQARATLEVKGDMENPSPMDRLVCGDVGFGKTEVAVRAAFKAVMNGKQVAMLVPTTILATQHYNTFIDRLGSYAVRIASLTRFRSVKEQKQILRDLAGGTIDILIGTHRILSHDVAFKDLGLLIIDEEHRFGVSAKEKLRRLRASVDTLTLTATPIPRTLQFSLLGARDLSLINTPPRNRLPIVTEIAQFDLRLIREAILKELHRGGQVYFIHDRIQNMDAVQTMLEEHVPEARFHAAHGQMPGHALEKTMVDFLNRKYDVLVCTKIIESGIDIPSVNTIIINRADRFGLAELYQLRGRVGRSNVQAYAYLLTPPLSVLPKPTLRRLQAIQEFTELGSGFNLAMRDLEIRGAGNLLGAEQSGFILEMGFEMYQKIVEEAVSELKETEFQQLFAGQPIVSTRPAVEAQVDIDVEAFIPDFYVESDAERLDLYRRLSQASGPNDIQSMREELRDRFGEYPEEVEHLFAVATLKLLASRLFLSRVATSGNEVALFFPPSDERKFYDGSNGQPSLFQTIMDSVSSRKHLHPRLKQEKNQLKLLLSVDFHDTPIKKLDAIRLLLEQWIPSA